MSPLLKPNQADWAFERCCPASGGRRQSFARNWGGLQRRCQPFASLLTSRPPATTDTIRNDACQGRGQIVRPVNPSAPQVEALDHECRRDWEAGVSGQGNVLVMFSPSLYAGFRASAAAALLVARRAPQRRATPRAAPIASAGCHRKRSRKCSLFVLSSANTCACACAGWRIC